MEFIAEEVEVIAELISALDPVEYVREEVRVAFSATAGAYIVQAPEWAEGLDIDGLEPVNKA
jgi:hypothetical protein